MARIAKRGKCKACGADILKTYVGTLHNKIVEVDIEQKIFFILFDGDRVTRQKGYEPHRQTCPMKGGNT
jgi:hypothetical protein